MLDLRVVLDGGNVRRFHRKALFQPGSAGRLADSSICFHNIATRRSQQIETGEASSFLAIECVEKSIVGQGDLQARLLLSHSSTARQLLQPIYIYIGKPRPIQPFRDFPQCTILRAGTRSIEFVRELIQTVDGVHNYESKRLHACGTH
jgi:hypothetical protein